MDIQNPHPLRLYSCANSGASLAWMELTTVLVKLLLTYDVKLLDTELDWHRDSRMATLWQKPELRVRITPRVLR